jgi:c-di-GMP-binding flagellar brake protein YcgR
MVQLDATVDDGQVARMYQTQNLSETGMLLRTRKPLPVGTDVAVQFLFPGDPMLSRATLPGGYEFVEGQAKVVRHTHPAKERIKGMALRFSQLDSSGSQRLGNFLLTQQLRGNLQTT